MEILKYSNLKHLTGKQSVDYFHISYNYLDINEFSEYGYKNSDMNKDWERSDL